MVVHLGIVEPRFAPLVELTQHAAPWELWVVDLLDAVRYRSAHDRAALVSERVCRTWLKQYAVAVSAPAQKGRPAVDPPDVSAAPTSANMSFSVGTSGRSDGSRDLLASFMSTFSTTLCKPPKLSPTSTRHSPSSDYAALAPLHEGVECPWHFARSPHSASNGGVTPTCARYSRTKGCCPDFRMFTVGGTLAS